MSLFSQRVNKQLRRVAAQRGEWVTLNGRQFRVLVEAESGANAGEQGVPRTSLGPKIASTTPSRFRFDAEDFVPTTDVPLPIQSDVIIRNNLNWEVEAVTFENIDVDTVHLFCHCLVKIWE